MLAASDDLIDLMHTHPKIADGTHEMQFDLVFPAAARLSHLGAVPAQGRREHGALRRAVVAPPPS
jgi:hypothetical protein